jgi:RimJ/RimL family protein N-acetyltransferase
VLLPTSAVPRFNVFDADTELRLTDVTAVQSWAGNLENVRYMLFGPNTEAQTHAFLDRVIAKWAEDPVINFEFAVVLKESGQVIGATSIHVQNLEGELGWIFHLDHWKKGYGTETARAVLQFGFERLRLRKILAACDVENYGSYRVMENIGMYRKGLFVKSRQANQIFIFEWRDEYLYAILAEDYRKGKNL